MARLSTWQTEFLVVLDSVQAMPGRLASHLIILYLWQVLLSMLALGKPTSAERDHLSIILLHSALSKL